MTAYEINGIVASAFVAQQVSKPDPRAASDWKRIRTALELLEAVEECAEKDWELRFDGEIWSVNDDHLADSAIEAVALGKKAAEGE